ncbi:MAG: protoporphyrinogen oxidase [Acidobacteria bacterium]|nr:protoporphyrinogen oxidase [Acidobacteriota bacterium]
MTRRCDVAIVGGGISGLATAYYLRRRRPDLAVLLLEASRYWGGKIITERQNGRIVEWGPDAFVTSKPDALELAGELGLSEQIIPSIEANSRTLVWRRGRLLPVPAKFFLLAPGDPVSFLKSPLFSLGGKVDVFWERFRKPAAGLEDESIASFVRRRFGEEALELLGGPLLAGIYMGDPEQLSIHSTFPQLVEIERSHGSVSAGLRKRRPAAAGARSLFVSFRDGMETLPRTLVSQLGGVLCPETAARRVVSASSGYRVICDRNEIEAARVVITSDPETAYALLAPLCLIPELKEFRSVSSVAVNLVYGPESSLPDAFGVLVPRAEGKQIAAITFSSKKFPGRVPQGESLLRVFLGGYGREEIVRQDDAAVLKTVFAELREIVGIDSQPRFRRVVRWGQANPQYLLGHRQRMERIVRTLAPLAGVYLAGGAYGGVGIPDCIAQAKRVTAAIG